METEQIVLDRPVAGYWYLATPYTNYPDGHNAAACIASELCASLINAELSVYSPITHMHALFPNEDLERQRTNHDFWMRIDLPLMDGARGLIVAHMDGWVASRGIAFEMDRFQRLGKPIIHWNHLFEVDKVIALAR